jgi:RNA polymerase sigma-70 factor (ECF subfamily)
VRVTDEALMTAVRDGDLNELGLLFERHHVALFDYLSRMTGDRAAAEDLVQDVFTRVLKYRRTYREDGRFETWLYRIARNARADYFRTRRPAEPIDEDVVERTPHGEPGPADTLEHERDVERLRRALLRLRDDKRELIVLARYRGMTHEEIGELLGVEAGAVKVRLHRAVKELRDIFLGLTERPPWSVTTGIRT